MHICGSMETKVAGKIDKKDGIKDQLARLQECITIRKQLVQLGIEHLDDFDELKNDMMIFIKDGSTTQKKEMVSFTATTHRVSFDYQ